MAFKVLVVDASESARAAIAAALESLGAYSVHETDSGFEALKVLPRHPFDLIIAALELPDIDGLELVNFVKKSPASRDTPLLVTGATAASAERRERGLALGAAEFVGTALDARALTAAVRRHLPPER